MAARFTVTALGGGGLVRTPEGLRFVNPGHAGGYYTNAQLDDYQGLPRAAFRGRPPLRLSLRARFSHAAGSLVGTAGFGFWNDPFLMTGLRTPALPQALWFFYAAPPSNMALAAGMPGHGWKAACIDARQWRGAAALPLAALAAPAMRVARIYRRLWPHFARAWRIGETLLPQAMTAWHRYVIEWSDDGARFLVDDRLVLAQAPAPAGPLGLVIWLDNQFRVVTPTGQLRHGLVARPAAQWMEIADLEIARGEGRGARGEVGA